MKRLFSLALLLLTVPLAYGASTDPDVEAAQKYVRLLQLRDFAAIEADADASIAGPAMEETLRKMASLLPQANAEAESLALVGKNTQKTAQGQESTVILEGHADESWLLLSVTLRGPSRRLLAFYVKPIPDSVEQMRRFSLVGKSAAQYAVLFASVLCAAVVIYALWLCVRSKTGRRKWFYSMLICFGICQCGVDWTTGETSTMLFAFHLPPMWMVALPYGPWVIYVSVPVGGAHFPDEEE